MAWPTCMWCEPPKAEVARPASPMDTPFQLVVTVWDQLELPHRLLLMPRGRHFLLSSKLCSWVPKVSYIYNDLSFQVQMSHLLDSMYSNWLQLLLRFREGLREKLENSGQQIIACMPRMTRSLYPTPRCKEQLMMWKLCWINNKLNSPSLCNRWASTKHHSFNQAKLKTTTMFKNKIIHQSLIPTARESCKRLPVTPRWFQAMPWTP